jgi:hypothetical protein
MNLGSECIIVERTANGGEQLITASATKLLTDSMNLHMDNIKRRVSDGEKTAFFTRLN